MSSKDLKERNIDVKKYGTKEYEMALQMGYQREKPKIEQNTIKIENQ